MRVIIAGSRGITSAITVSLAMQKAAEQGIVPTTVLSGCAPGVDKLGEQWASVRGIPVERHPANWASYPRTAGRLRNVEMAHAADALVAIWDGASPGTRHMIKTAEARGLQVLVWV